MFLRSIIDLYAHRNSPDLVAFPIAETTLSEKMGYSSTLLVKYGSIPA
jgi:hypothetical protein